MSGLLVHEWIAEHGGSENVLVAMHETFPEAEIRCLWSDAPSRLADAQVHQSWLASTFLRNHKSLALPFMSSTWKRTDLTQYSWVLVSSHLFAHHVASSPSAKGVPIFVYTHTPARYIWEPELDGRGRHPLARVAAAYFRSIDKKVAAGSGASFAANSAFVRDRIRNTWGVDSHVIYPPVNIERLRSVSSWQDRLVGEESEAYDSLPDHFILGASRFVSYKDLPRVVEVGEASGIPVVLADGGPLINDLRKLASSASVPVHIIEQPSNAMLYALFERAALYVFPPIEDFGIMPVEAMALGTPVLVNPVGGASESVRLVGGGGILPYGHEASALRAAVDSVIDLDMSTAVEAVSQFSNSSFREQLSDWMAIRGADMPRPASEAT